MEFCVKNKAQNSEPHTTTNTCRTNTKTIKIQMSEQNDFACRYFHFFFVSKIIAESHKRCSISIVDSIEAIVFDAYVSIGIPTTLAHYHDFLYVCCCILMLLVRPHSHLCVFLLSSSINTYLRCFADYYLCCLCF